MNKKFSTLVAGVLLASGVGASAQTFNPQVFSSAVSYTHLTLPTKA